MWRRAIKFVALLCALPGFATPGFSEEILTQEERLWLTQNQPRLVLAVETAYAPFAFLDAQDQPAGLAQDYLRLIETRLDVRFKQRRFSTLNAIFDKVRSGEVHIVNAVTNTPERAKFLTMTNPFVSVPNVIIVRKERTGTIQANQLSGLKVSLVQSYAVTDHLAGQKLGYTPILVPDDLTALLNVSFGQSDAAVIDLATASYLISQKGITNLQVAGDAGFDIGLAIGTATGEPMLHSILEKGLAALTREEKQQIHNRWINASEQSLFLDRRFWIAAGSALFIVLVLISIILIWNRTLRIQVALRTEALTREREYIAGRKLAEELLQNSEARLRAVLDATPFPIALADLHDQRIHFWSRSALTLFGHTAPSTEQWYELAYPDPDYRNEVLERWQPCLEKARSSEQTVNTGEHRIACRDGSVRICELYITVLSDNLIVTFNDVTERTRAEGALKRQMDELERFNRAMVGRELQMIALKQEINALCQALGAPARYLIRTQTLPEALT